MIGQCEIRLQGGEVIVDGGERGKDSVSMEGRNWGEGVREGREAREGERKVNECVSD